MKRVDPLFEQLKKRKNYVERKYYDNYSIFKILIENTSQKRKYRL